MSKHIILISIESINKALKWGKNTLLESGIKDAVYSAEILLCDITGYNRLQLYSHYDEKLSNKNQQIYLDYINRRLKNEPIQYILSYTYFRNLKISVCRGVLIPRPETEMLIEIALKHITHDKINVLDLCTGSGCIAAAIAKEVKNSHILAVDVSDKAINCAKHNFNNLCVNNRVKTLQHNVFKAYDYGSNFDLIISNPPYVPSSIICNLDFEVTNYEPIKALEAGALGLDFVPKLCEIAKKSLKNNGFLAMELFEDSIDEAICIAKDFNFNRIKKYKDLAGKDRFLFCKI